MTKAGIFIALLIAAFQLSTVYVEPAMAAQDYSEGLEQARRMAATGDYPAAEQTLRQLAVSYPDNPEILASLGRIRLWQKDYAGAVLLFRQSLSVKNDPSVLQEMVRAETTELLVQADLLAKNGDMGGAVRIWQELDSSGRDSYMAGYRLALNDMSRRNYPEARQRLSELNKRYPRENDVRALYLECLILNGEELEAHKLIASLTPAEIAGLSKERPDLPFRLLRNSLKLEGGVFEFSGNRPNEQDLAVTLTQHIGPITGVLSGSQVRRFGLFDRQAGVELHSSLGSQSARSGNLSATFCPNASFLPRYTVGGEYYQGWRGVEGSLGFSHLSFSDSNVNILIPGVTLYPAETISLNERIYLVLDNGATTALTTLNWKPDYRFNGAYAISIGSAAERITGDVLTRYFTVTHQVTGEYRITPAISFGAELSHEYRRGLYTRAGASLFGRYWW